MEQPNRNYTDGTYRYGFQGQEKDDELKGKGNSVNYKYRMHDPRVGRFFAVDPLTENYPHYTPYSFSGNKTIAFRELEGQEEKYYLLYFKDGKTLLELKSENNRWYVPDGNTIFVPDDQGGGVSYTFSKPIYGALGGYTANRYQDFDKFMKNPIKAIASGKYKTNEEITREGLEAIVMTLVLRKISKIPVKNIKQVDLKGKRLPKTNGSWKGDRGNGYWFSNNEKVKAITNGKGIPFKNGYPDFSKWSKGEIKIKNLDGTNKDFDKVYEVIMNERGLKSKNAARKFLKDRGLTAHHHQDGTTIQFIPSDLHNNIPHVGGASILRNSNKP